jgi:hypothetical protein
VNGELTVQTIDFLGDESFFGCRSDFRFIPGLAFPEGDDIYFADDLFSFMPFLAEIFHYSELSLSAVKYQQIRQFSSVFFSAFQ